MTELLETKNSKFKVLKYGPNNLKLSVSNNECSKDQSKRKISKDSLDSDNETRKTLSIKSISTSTKTLNSGNSSFPLFINQEIQRPQKPSQKLCYKEEDRRHQAKLLLVSLLENFCLLYDESPQRNHNLFLVICKRLSSMGVIDEEYIDELSGVRHSYMNAFKEVVIQASQEVEKEKSLKQEKKPYSLQYFPAEGSYSNDSSEDINSNTKTLNSQIKSLDDLLNLSESRYRTDFEENISIGKGGFGSVWMAKNKLNGIWYAIKKIRLKEHYKYDRMLREIKSLARLDHVNIIRYYCSWLEYVDHSGESADLEDSISQFDSFISEPVSSVHSISLNNQVKPNCIPSSCDTIFPSNYDFDSESENSCSDLSSNVSIDDDSASSQDSSIDSLNKNFVKSKFFGSDTSSEDSGDSVSSAEYNLDSIEALSDFGIDFIHENKENSQMSDNLMSSLTTNPSIETSKNINSQHKINSQHRQLTLFIQMQLCGSTLKDFLDWRNSGASVQLCSRNNEKHNNIIHKDNSEPKYFAIDPVAKVRLFRSIVEGVDYIHQSGLIHRDLKPANIFLSLPQEAKIETISSPQNDPLEPLGFSFNQSNNSDCNKKIAPQIDFQDFDRLIPKIGDFGLATSFTETNLIFQHGPRHNSSRTSQVGTYTYASPEQLSVPPVAYNEKSDIYSLGIIFFELFYPFATGMERVKALKDLRQGILPEDFLTKWPKEAAFVLWLTAENPDFRPSAKEMLEFELLNPLTSSQSNLADQLALKDEIINRLETENRSLHEDVDSLKKQVALLQLAMQNK